MFIGREKELEQLNNLYHAGKLQMVGIYGRRHIGKTALIREFIQGKNCLYFQAWENNEKANLALFRRRVVECGFYTSTEMDEMDNLKLVENLFILSEKKPMALVLDEVQYLARFASDLVKTLVYMIERFSKTSKMMIILTSSSLSFVKGMRHNKSILTPYITSTLKLEPMDFETSCRFLSKFSEEDKAILYGILGGTPMYLRQMNSRMSLGENVKATFLDDASQIFTEPEFLLRQEVREPALYHGIMTAIGSGAMRMSEISAWIGENTNICSTYLKNLIQMDLVRKEMPYGENGRKSIYQIADPMMRFWYRFLPNHLSQIACGESEQVWRQIQPQLDDYMEVAFVHICRQYLESQKNQGKSPVNFQKLGTWWGTDREDRKRIVIDLMGEENSNKALIAECKWTKEKVEMEDLRALLDKGKQFTYQSIHYYLFAKKGFTKECIQEAGKNQWVRLVTFRL